MATLTREDMAVRIMENIGVLAAGETASANDTERVEEFLDSAHARLHREGLAPFDLATTPEWAQVPLRDYVSAELIAFYGIGPERAQALLMAQAKAMKDLAKQTSVQAQQVPVRPHWF